MTSWVGPSVLRFVGAESGSSSMNPETGSPAALAMSATMRPWSPHPMIIMGRSELDMKSNGCFEGHAGMLGLPAGRRDGIYMIEQSKRSRQAPTFDRLLQIVRPTFPAVDGILSRFVQSLAAGQVTNNGPWVVKFERLLEDYLGVPTLVFS